MKCPSCRTENPPDSKFCKECATPLPPIQPGQPSPLESLLITETLEAGPQELTTGSLFAGRYQIIEELGHGGMGRVYRALDKKLNEEVALKLVRPEIAADRQTLERFHNELKLARKISHPHVGRMYELMEEKGSHFITMEYVPGQDLRGLIRQTGKLTAETAVSIAKQVCEGLSEAHKQGIIHRDLKPSNIIIDRAGSARIMDFGIARSLTMKSRTGAGVMIGTPEYMSPEQVEGKEVDQRSDIYSLGIILYEMLTGRVPFEGDTPFTIGMKQKSEAPKNPKLLNPNVPDNLSAVILKCLEKDKSKRCQSAGDVRAELERTEKGLPTTARPAPERRPFTSKEITVKFQPKRLIVPALGMVAVIVIAALFIPRLFLKKKVPPAATAIPSVAVLPFDDLSPQKDQGYICDGMTEELINRLSNIRELRVPARTSVFTFKGKAQDLREIGKILNVGTVLEGSVRKAGDQLRVTAQLRNTADDSSLWSETYDRELKDIFAIQDEIAQAVVDKLKLTLLSDEKAKLASNRAIDPRAYEEYLKGRDSWWQFSEDGIKDAILHFRRALDIEPNYAPAQAGLAMSYIAASTWVQLWPSREGVLKGKEIALRTIESNPMLADGYIALAQALFNFDWDWEGAERALRRALELNPSSSIALDTYGNWLTAQGRFDEAISVQNQALELDPLSPALYNDLGIIYWEFRQFDRAIPHFRKALELDRNFYYSRNLLGLAYLWTGKRAEAKAEFQALAQAAPDLPWVQGALGYFYSLTGRPEEAGKALANLDRLADTRYVTHCARAMIYVGLDQKSLALDWLEKAVDDHDGWMWDINVTPWWDPLRNEPRFQALVKKMGLGKS